MNKNEKYRENMLKVFPSPFDNNDDLTKVISNAVEAINKLRPDLNGPAYLGKNPALTIDFDHVKDAKIPEKMSPQTKVINEVVELFDGMPNWGSPLAMMNVIPQANSASIVASILAIIFSPNILEGEYAWNTHKAELETAGMLGDLFGWDGSKAGTVFTYGGSGCWTYHVKYALTRVLKNSRNSGVRVDGKVICSEQAHYTMMNSTDWMGLGMDNIVKIPTIDKTNEMDLEVLESVLKDLKEKDIPVISVVCTMGTTDANAFDPIESVRKLLDKYPNNDKKYGKAFLYADAVIGWAWATFNNYDFKSNPLGFSENVIQSIKENVFHAKQLKYADAVGVDFHKSGWSPYVSSCFVYKNNKEFEELMSRPGSAYLQPRSPYNPLDYTLEVSRSAQGSLAAWATLKTFGLEGFQSILGGTLEVHEFLKQEINKRKNMVCVNKFDTGLVTLFRIYDKSIKDAKEEYVKELNDKNHEDQLIKHNLLIHKIGDKLWDWFRSNKKINGKFTPYMSFSTGFRTTNYNHGFKKDPKAYVYALKVFPMNVHITKEVFSHVLDCVEAAAQEVYREEGLE